MSASLPLLSLNVDCQHGTDGYYDVYARDRSVEKLKEEVKELIEKQNAAVKEWQKFIKTDSDWKDDIDERKKAEDEWNKKDSEWKKTMDERKKEEDEWNKADKEWKEADKEWKATILKINSDLGEDFFERNQKTDERNKVIDTTLSNIITTQTTDRRTLLARLKANTKDLEKLKNEMPELRKLLQK